MELAHALARLWKAKLGVAVGLLLAGTAGLATAYDIRISPLSVTPKPLSSASATTQFVIDAPRSVVTHLATPTYELDRRAQLYALALASAPLRARIGRATGVPASGITMLGTPAGPQLVGVTREPTAEERANDLRQEGNTRAVTFAPEFQEPIVDVATQGPTPAEAVRLAAAATAAARGYVEDLQRRTGVRPSNRLIVRPSGPPIVARRTSLSNVVLDVVIGTLAFIAWCILLLMTLRVRDRARASRVAASRPWRALTTRGDA